MEDWKRSATGRKGNHEQWAGVQHRDVVCDQWPAFISQKLLLQQLLGIQNHLLGQLRAIITSSTFHGW